jgi:DNA-binding response OmpR family regulator
MASATEGELHHKMARLEADLATIHSVHSAETARLQALLSRAETAAETSARTATTVEQENQTLGMHAAQKDAEMAVMREELRQMQATHADRVQALEHALEQVRPNEPCTNVRFHKL